MADPRDTFIEMIARLSASGDKVDLDGEEWPNGYEHDTGSSLDALDELIHKAREIAGIKPPEPQPAYDELDWSGPEEGDTCDVSVWITTADGDELCEIETGNGVEANKEVARAVVAEMNAMERPWPDGILDGIVKAAIAKAAATT
jgi:hypothetical protein